MRRVRAGNESRWVVLFLVVGCTSSSPRGLVVRDDANAVLVAAETAIGTQRVFHFDDGTNFSVGGGTCTIDVWNDEEAGTYFTSKCAYELVDDDEICFADGTVLRDLLELDPQNAATISVSGCVRVERDDFRWCGCCEPGDWPRPPTTVAFVRKPDRVCVSLPHEPACPLESVHMSTRGIVRFDDDDEAPRWEFCAEQPWCPSTPVTFIIIDACHRYERMEAQQCFGSPVVSGPKD